MFIDKTFLELFNFTDKHVAVCGMSVLKCKRLEIKSRKNYNIFYQLFYWNKMK